MGDDATQVRHVIKTGLKKGQRYNVYVTQVNNAGVESLKSNPAQITVGDITPPPIPPIYLDSCHRNNGKVDVNVRWATPVCDDLSHYVLYTWESIPPAGYVDNKPLAKAVGVTATTQRTVTADALSYTLTNQKSKIDLYVGIQAYDTNGNYGNIGVVKVFTMDISPLAKPTNVLNVVPGSWSMALSVVAPDDVEVDSIVFFRDGISQLAAIKAYPNQITAYIDTLPLAAGLKHRYQYQYLTKDGQASPFSDWSEFVTAMSVDIRMLDQAQIEALKDAWNVDNVNSLDELHSQMDKRAQEIQNNANAIQSTTRAIEEVAKSYRILAGKIDLISSAVKTQDNRIASTESSISSIPGDINLKVQEINQTIDSVQKNLQTAYIAAINLQKDRITTLVSNLDSNTGIKNYAGLTNLADQIGLKVNADGIITALNLTKEGTRITGRLLHVDSNALFEKDVNIQGKLMAEALQIWKDNTYQYDFADVLIGGNVNATFVNALQLNQCVSCPHSYSTSAPCSVASATKTAHPSCSKTFADCTIRNNVAHYAQGRSSVLTTGWTTAYSTNIVNSNKYKTILMGSVDLAYAMMFPNSTCWVEWRVLVSRVSGGWKGYSQLIGSRNFIDTAGTEETDTLDSSGFSCILPKFVNDAQKTFNIAVQYRVKYQGAWGLRTYNNAFGDGTYACNINAVIS